MFNLQSKVFRMVAIILTLVMVATPVLAQDLENSKYKESSSSSFGSSSDAGGDPVADAYSDAEAEIGGGTWFAIGCLLGWVGWLIAYVVEPTPPASRLIGKSSNYVIAYTSAFKEKGKSIQSVKARNGCIVGTVVSVVLYVVMVASVATTTTTTTY
ncbi:MAG: hypothetical protein JNL74_07040 [Fibrobacteres bacterium]|nr:hypothetical protein [Fibrobacterota bacterium]